MTKQLTGPGNYEAWRACWRVFRTAMLMLMACPPRPMDEYEENIRQLSLTYGVKAWGLTHRAGDVMRSEHWERLRQRIEEKIRNGHYLDTWDPQRDEFPSPDGVPVIAGQRIPQP